MNGRQQTSRFSSFNPTNRLSLVSLHFANSSQPTAATGESERGTLHRDIQPAGTLVDHYEAIIVANSSSPRRVKSRLWHGSFCTCLSRDIWLRVEGELHRRLREFTGLQARVASITVLVAGGFIACAPFLLTGGWSVEEVDGICEERFAKGWPESDIDNSAESRMFPTHWWNCAALAASSAFLLVWMHHSPHNNEKAKGWKKAKELDRKLGSYCMMQYVANTLVAMTHMTNCTSSPVLALLLFFVNIVSFFGLSALATNLLSHRYLLERAKVMNGNTHTVGTASPENLEKIFKFELRVLYMVPVILAAYLFGLGTVALVAGGIFAILILVFDMAMSVLLTKSFLQPIYQVLEMVQEGDIRCQGKHELELLLTKRTVLIGSTIAVFSSTLLYINAVFFFSWDASIKKSIWLNILVFGGNADSILNDLGMFLVCGAVKHFALSHIFNRILKSSSMIFGSYKNKSSQSIESVGSNFRKTPIMRERRIASGQGQGSVSLSLEPSSSEGGQEQCVHPECPSTQISATR